MLASLLKQIYARRPDTPEPIRRLGEYKARGERPDTETLEATLLATIHGFSTIFFVIDALDECPSLDGERRKLLSSLRRVIAAMPDNLHILCTSRAESDIIAAMGTVMSPPSRAEIDLTNYRDSLNRDIGLYIDETLASAAYSTWPTDLKEEAKELLIGNADGMWVEIFIPLMQEPISPLTVNIGSNIFIASSKPSRISRLFQSSAKSSIGSHLGLMQHTSGFS